MKPKGSRQILRLHSPQSRECEAPFCHLDKQSRFMNSNYYFVSRNILVIKKLSLGPGCKQL